MKIFKRPQRIVGWAAAVVCLFALSACDSTNLATDRLQIRVVDGELQVRSCEPIDALAITVQANDGGGWKDIWVAEGDARLDPQQPLRADDLGTLFSTVDASDEPAGMLGEKVAVLIDTSTDSMASRFRLDDAALAGVWADPDDTSLRDCPAP